MYASDSCDARVQQLCLYECYFQAFSYLFPIFTVSHLGDVFHTTIKSLIINSLTVDLFT